MSKSSKLREIVRQIPFAESLRSFLEQWGLWQWVIYIAVLVGAILMTAWAWLESKLPYWAIAAVFLGSFAAFLALVNCAYGILLKRRQSHLLDTAEAIDRNSLADELEDISRKIAALVGEYRGPMQEAWWKDARNLDPNTIRESHTRIEGKLIEKFSDRYAADVWRLIRRASKVVPIDRSEIWQLRHGMRGEHDLVNIYMFLASLADDVRTPKPPLPMTDRRLEEHRARSASSALSLPIQSAAEVKALA